MEDVLERFGISNCKPVSTPLDLIKTLRKELNDSGEDDKNLPFREPIGSLMYLSVTSRPDIAYAVGALSQFNNYFNRTHWIEANCILRYLRGTSNVGLTYKAYGASIEGYANADWGNCAEDRKSFTGYCYNLAGAAISWASKK